MEILNDPLDQTEGDELGGLPGGDLAAGAEALTSEFPAGALGIAEIADAPSHLDPHGVVPKKLLAEALAFFQAHREKFKNRGHISVLDYSLRSSEPRFHVIDMQTGDVQSFRMANGIGSEPDHDGFAHRFSNVPGSNMSSLGFVRTAETYEGKHGFSLRLDGLSETNSRLRERAVVVHGADYVHDKAVIQGRSNGCPAVPMDQRTKVINLIKEGSLMYFARSQA
jgi:L,D-transpeptidase-like protein